MIKIIHLTFVLLAISSFIGRFVLLNTQPDLLKQKIFKITPHVIDTLLLLSGITLVFQGQWLSGEYGWLIAKIIVLFGYVGLGVLAMRSEGTLRWQTFGGAIVCFLYIGMVAATKHAFIFS